MTGPYALAACGPFMEVKGLRHDLHIPILWAFSEIKLFSADASYRFEVRSRSCGRRSEPLSASPILPKPYSTTRRRP